MEIVVLGGSFGGLNVAFELRKNISSDHNVTVISNNQQFVFIPSLPWVSLGWRKAKDIVFDIKKPLASKGIKFLFTSVKKISQENNLVTTDKGEISYDYLVISTGADLEFESVSGLGPDNYTQSTCTLEHAEKAYDAWKKLLLDPGPIVIGAAQGVSCFGPAYEQAFMIDTELRRIRRRHEMPITFITSEPYLGHLGIGGVGKIRRVAEDEFAERDIKTITNAIIEDIAPDKIRLNSGKELKFKYAMIIPPFLGIKAIRNSKDLGNPRGFIPVDKYYRHIKYPNIYSVGVAMAIMPPEPTPVPTGVPKTAYMTDRMAKMVANNISAEINKEKKKSETLDVICFMDMGDSAILMSASPVLPPRDTFRLKKNRIFHWFKVLYERYYLWKLKNGYTWMP